MSEQPTYWYPFKQWCEAKHFTVQHGYNLIRRGELSVVKSGWRTFVTEQEDQRFNEASAVANLVPVECLMAAQK